MSRHVIVVDVETTGLFVERDAVVEVAWHNLTTNESGVFVPPHKPVELGNADLKALQMNRYVDRLALADRDRGDAAWELAEQLEGNTLAGSNPAFDAAFLNAMFTRQYSDDELAETTWHHRLLDLSAYAAGVLGLPPTELPGLAKVCELLDVTNAAPHTAMGDVQATAECFRKLMAVKR
jgi:DNA polymerase III epsilon subunit-like protein